MNYLKDCGDWKGGRGSSKASKFKLTSMETIREKLQETLPFNCKLEVKNVVARSPKMARPIERMDSKCMFSNGIHGAVGNLSTSLEGPL